MSLVLGKRVEMNHEFCNAITIFLLMKNLGANACDCRYVEGITTRITRNDVGPPV
jgi:hypothetical protein